MSTPPSTRSVTLGLPTRLHERILLGRQAVLTACALACWLLRAQVSDPAAVLFILAGVAVANTIHYVLNRRGRFGRTLVIAQLVLDTGATSFMAYSTGGVHSPLTLLYVAEILSGAFNLSFLTCVAATVLSWAGLAVVAAITVPRVPAAFFLVEVVLLGAVGGLTLDVIRSLRQTLQFRSASAAHEIKNSVHVAQSLVGEALNLAGTSPAARTSLEAACVELDGLSQLARRLYDRSVLGSRRWSRAATIVEEALLLAGPSLRDARLRVSLELPSRGCLTRADREQLRHAFLNLFLNASQHTPAGGRMVVWCSRAGGWLDVNVETSGPGQTAAEARPVAAGAGAGGWGVGLCVTRDLVQEHGGRLRVRSIPDGVRVTVSLPAFVIPGFGAAETAPDLARSGAG